MGHASRMLMVADMLKETGTDVRFSSSGEVTRLIRSRGYVCNDLPLADVKYTEEGSFSLRRTMIDSPRVLVNAYRQGIRELASLERFGPNAVLSDSALPTLLAARIAGVPVFTVLNQLSLTSSHGKIGLPSLLLSEGLSAVTGRLWELSREVLLPDLPPPYTISESNLWGSNVSKTRYIGFLTLTGEEGPPDSAFASFASDPRRKVFWQVSGPPNTRGPFLKRALEYAEALSGRFVFAITAGDPAGSPTAVAVPGGWYYGWCRIPGRYFAACDAVVSRAGHGTIGQAITFSKPSLLVPIPRQPEQEGNGRKAERLGISSLVGQAELTPERTAESLNALLNGGAAERATRLGEYAGRFKATEEIVRTLGSAAI